jgi:hypothetical protein
MKKAILILTKKAIILKTSLLMSVAIGILISSPKILSEKICVHEDEPGFRERITRGS